MTDFTHVTHWTHATAVRYNPQGRKIEDVKITASRVDDFVHISIDNGLIQKMYKLPVEHLLDLIAPLIYPSCEVRA